MLAIPETAARVLSYIVVRSAWRVLDVVRIGIVRNLVKVFTHRSYEPELVGRIDVENQRAKASIPIRGIVNYLGDRRLQTQVASIPVHAGIVGETFGVAAKADLRVRLVKTASAQNYFGFVVTLETGAGDDVKNAVGPVAKLSAVTSAIDFHIVDVFGVDLRAEV